MYLQSPSGRLAGLRQGDPAGRFPHRPRAADGSAGKTRPPAPFTRRVVTPRGVLGVASLGAALAFVDATIVNVAFPDIREDFPGASLAGISWVLNAYNIVFAAFIVAAGRIADLVGRKRLFEWGIVMFTLASVLCALAPSLGLLVTARMLQATGAAILVPASLALVLEGFPQRERAHGVALWSAAAALAAGLGPSLGGVLVEAGGWRLAFLVNLPIGIVAVLASKRMLVESRAPGRRTIPDLLGALMLAGATGALTLGIVKGNDWGFTSPGVLVSFGAALALGAVLLGRCAWHRSPMIDLTLVRIRSVAGANAVTLLAAAGFYAYVLCNVLFLTSVWDYSVLEAGLAITPGPFVAAAVARPASRLAARIGPAPTIAGGALIWTAGLAYLVMVVGPIPDFLGQWLPGMLVLGVGAGVTFPVVGSTAVAEVTGGRFATAIGINSIARQLGAVLGVALLVAIVGTPRPAEVAGAFDRGWMFAAVCLGTAAIAAFAIGRVDVAEEEAAGEDVQARRGPMRSLHSHPRLPPRAAGPPVHGPRRTPAESLRQVPMFAGLPDTSLERLAERATPVRVQAGEWVFRQGDAADGVYVVVSGRLEVVHEQHGQSELLRVVGADSVLGELALLANTGERSASIRAGRDSELLRLGREEFDHLVADDPRFTAELVRLMGLELQGSRVLHPTPTGATSVIALVPAHDGLPLEPVAAALMDELALGGPAVRLDGPSATPIDPAAQAALLERYEVEHEHVLLVASADDPWRDFCLRHADRVALLAGERPPPGGIAGSSALRGCELLFLTDGRSDPSGITEWLDVLEPRARYRLDQGDRLAPSVAVAARRFAGRSIGVVLSGGGARAFAHIGVLEELLAAGIAIDRVGGCSMGAFIGALLAMGTGVEEIDARCYEEWVRRNPLTDYRLPRHSLIRGDRVSAMLARNLPGGIETLARDYFCVSADLPTAELVVHRRGPLDQAVGASMSLPGLVAPQLMGERMLVDGGVLNNLPVEVMAATGEGPVIAVDVTNRFEPPTAADGPRLPSITETLTRALMLGSVDTAEAARTHAALVIAPPNHGVGILEFHQLDRMREAGRRAAREALDRAEAPL